MYDDRQFTLVREEHTSLFCGLITAEARRFCNLDYKPEFVLEPCPNQ